MQRREIYNLATIFFVAFALRLGIAIWLPEEVIWPDGARYEEIALNLVQGNGFGSLSSNKQSVPTQPLLIAGVYKLFGQDYFALRILFAFLGSLSCVLGSMLAKTLFGSRSALPAGLLLAGYPYLVYLSALFEYPQTFFIFVMASFFLLYYRFKETQSKPLLFFAALSLGLGVLSVPTTLIFAIAFAFLLLTRNLRETLLRLTIVAAAFGLTVGTWTLRNYVAYGQIIIVNAAGGGAFWTGNNETYWKYGKPGVVPACAPGYEGTTYCKEVQALSLQLEQRNLGDVESALEEERISWQHGLAFVRDRPGRFVLLTLRKFGSFWSPTPDAVHQGDEHGGKWRDLIAAATYTPILLLAVFGLISTLHQWRRLLPIYIYVVLFVTPYAIFLPATRYRLPIDFVLILFAAVALARLWELWSRNKADGHKGIESTTRGALN